MQKQPEKINEKQVYLFLATLFSKFIINQDDASSTEPIAWNYNSF